MSLLVVIVIAIMPLKLLKQSSDLAPLGPFFDFLFFLLVVPAPLHQGVDSRSLIIASFTDHTPRFGDNLT